MKPIAVLGCWMVLAQVGLAGCSDAPKVPICSEQQLSGVEPGMGEQQDHRQFRLPTVTYPYGKKLDEEDSWGFLLRLRVDGTGRVSCYSTRNFWDEELELNRQRRSLLAELHQWRYQPFFRDGKAVEAVVAEMIYEEEAAPGPRPFPEVPLEQVQIGLSRSQCFGSCPAYNVEVYGDGRVVYTGEHYVDVVGEHAYRIAPERVAELVNSMRAKRLWSLRRSYSARITDHSTQILTLRLGDQVHRIVDYAGEIVGMPKSVSEFENEVDELSQGGGVCSLVTRRGRTAPG